MDEITAKDTRVEAAPPDERRSDGTSSDGNEENGPDMEELRRIRLKGFLHELVSVKGPMETARLLGVNYKTVARAAESTQITRHMARALEALLDKAEGAEMVRLRKRVGGLEQRVDTLAGDPGDNPDDSEHRVPGEDGTSVTDEVRGQMTPGRDDPNADEVLSEVKEEVHGESAERPQQGPADPVPEQSVVPFRSRQVETVATSPVPGMHSKKGLGERRSDPEVVTEEPGADDPGLYGPAWSLVEEWRRLRAGHPHRGATMSWLVTEERLLVLELAMLEEFGLTLPPETEPLRGFGRRGQTGWRWKALDDTQMRLRKRRRLRWLRRAFTCGLWWR